MAEREDVMDDSGAVRRRNPDLLMLLAGILSLVVAAAGITGVGLWDYVDLRWVLAGTAVAAGIAFLLASLRNSRTTTND